MLALLLALLALFGALPQGSAPAATGIECSTCKGTGRALQDCLVCAGKKQIECDLCSAAASAGSDFDADLDLRSPKPDPEALKLNAALRKLFEARKMWLGEPVPGQARCPALCKDGKGLLNPGKTCKFCAAKGHVTCPRCKRKGVLRCATCEGSGSVQRACEDCLGTGRRPDPARIPPTQRAACPLCSGAGTWTCRECDEQGMVEGSCRACNGDGLTPCTQCMGTRQKPCLACSATGDNTGFLAAKSSNRCKQCDAKGLVACTECTRGSVTCPACKGQRVARQRCRACFGTHARLCEGCARGSFHAWELAGETLLGAGDAQAAHDFFELARGRVEHHFEILAQRAFDPKEAAKALEKERKLDSDRLDKRLASTRTPAK